MTRFVVGDDRGQPSGFNLRRPRRCPSTVNTAWHGSAMAALRHPSKNALNLKRASGFAASVMTVLLLALTGLSMSSQPGIGGPADPLDSSYYPAVSTAGIPANVWVTGALAKVQPNGSPGTQQVVQISAARNEFESFQVHVLAQSTPIQLSVTVSDFVNAQTGTVISGASNVLVHREAYLNITQLSDGNGTTGLTPDPLIPTQDPYFHQARNAFPVTVPVNQVQSTWIDVQVPDTAPSGYYSATVTVSDGASVLASVPAVLKVWDFSIPSTASLKSAFGMSFEGFCLQAYRSYTDCAQYPGSGGSSDRAIELTHVAQATLALDHRISISDAVYVGPPGGDWAHFDATYGALLNGSAGTLLYGAQLTSLRYAPPGYSITPSTIQDWVSHFTSAGWLPALFQYTCDEPPNGCSWSQLASDLSSVHGASSSMNTLVTTDIASATQNNVLGGINILVPIVNLIDPQGSSNQRSNYDAWLGGPNTQLWWYQACSSHGSCSDGVTGPQATATWPSYMVDATPVRNRVFQWLAFINNIQGELYYAADYCFYAHGGTSDCPGTDPWSSVYAFGGNGDGTLFYPGTVAKVGGTTPIPISSIRLKLIRDGMEDYEYLKALSDAGEDTFARSTAATFITNSYTINNDPQAMADARETLGSELHRLALQGTINTPLLSVSTTTNVTASGPGAGPFSPTSFQYQLSSSAGRAGYSITGIPNWLDASTVSGTATTTGSTITFTLNASANSLAPGTYNATITFTNTTNNQGTQTRSATLTIGATTVQLSMPPNPSVYGQPVTLSANVTPVSQGGTPTGSVSFMDAATTLGSGALSGGHTSINIALGVGGHTITAVYGGDAAFNTSTSTAATQTVARGSTSVVVTAAPNPSSAGQSVTFTATVAATPPASGTATGTATLMDSSATLGSAILSNGQATLSSASLNIGSHSITAVYNGDANFTGNTSPTLSQGVNTGTGSNQSVFWVSSSGSDINSCSEISPCLTFQGAIDKGNAGQINCLTSGNYGPVTIVASITIDCGTGNVGNIVSSSANGITINAGAAATVVLRHLVLDGLGSNTMTGINATSFFGGSLIIEDCMIHGYANANGIYFNPSSGRGLLQVSNSQIFGNLNGITISPASSQIASVTLNRVELVANSNVGLALAGGVVAGTMRYSVVGSNGGDGFIAQSSQVFFTIEESSIVDNLSIGVHANSAGVVNVGNSTIGGNGTGVKDNTGSVISFGNNQMSTNGSNGTFTSTTRLQ